jgi:hypothetical protein
MQRGTRRIRSCMLTEMKNGELAGKLTAIKDPNTGKYDFKDVLFFGDS